KRGKRSMAEIAPGSEEIQTQMQLDQATTYAKSLTATIARAIRLRAAGQDLNASEVRRQAHQTYEQLLSLLPVEQEPEPVTFSPLDLMQRYWESQAQRKERAATGFPALNRALSGGLERDRLYVLLGAPGSGKTTLVNQVCDHLGRERAVFYVTSENAPMDLLVKTIARRAHDMRNELTETFPSVLRGTC
ncbi:MAG TPA: ATPase domain-containing protein, partial [Ktedonobacteraceae bacterium]|nr:ATPase domain-containing protein [Ktedonobacteraceae bacterium]